MAAFAEPLAAGRADSHDAKASVQISAAHAMPSTSSVCKDSTELTKIPLCAIQQPVALGGLVAARLASKHANGFRAKHRLERG